MRTCPLLAVFLLLCPAVLQSQTSPDTLVVGYTDAAPFIMEGSDGLEGISIWLWEQIAEEQGITFRYEKIAFKNLIDSLTSGYLDISINPLTITSDRNRKIIFTHSFYASNSTVAIANRSSLQKLGQFIRSFFSLNFLRGLVALLIIIGFFGIVTWWLERKKNPEQFRPGWRGIWDGLWWSTVTMTTVGYGDKSPKSRGGKIVALIWMFAAIMFISGFTASIASSLTVNHMSEQNENLADFQQVPVGTIRHSSTIKYLQYQFFDQISTYEDLQTGLTALSKGEIKAFLYDEPILKYRITDSAEFPDIRVLPIKFDLQLYAFAFAPGRDSIEKNVSQEILEIVEEYDWKRLLAEYKLSQF